MSWPRFALEHRYTVFASLMAVIVFGVAARLGLPVQLFPDTDPPVVTIITPYPGVAAEDVAKNVSKPIEEEVGGIDGIARVTSTSQTGLSVVKAEFHYTRPVGEAAMDVQNAVSRLGSKLPAGVSTPQVLQFSSSDRPIVTLAVRSEQLPLETVRELADNELRDRLQLVAGVATVDVFGGNKRRLEVAVQRDRLRAYGLDMGAVETALRAWNLSESGGRVDRGAQEAVVRFDTPLLGVEDAARLIIAHQGDRRVRLDDVADLRFAPGEPRSAYRLNGEAAIALQVLKRDDANTVQVAAEVRETLARLRTDFPALDLQIADDDSVFTELVIDNMTGTVLIAIALTVGVIVLFLANLRQAAIVAVSIPVSFLMTFSLMYVFGIDLNMVTMSAIILAIGLLVDDAILVLENVNRHLTQHGKSPLRAAFEGTEEIFLADLAGTVTTIAVLVPLGFLGGFVGKLFGPLAWTLVFAFASSFIVSVTLIPLLTALWLRDTQTPGRLARWVAPFTTFMEIVRALYLRMLDAALRHPWRTVGVALVVVVLGGRLMTLVGSEMLPRFDSGNFQVLVDTVPGTALEETLAVVEAVERALLVRPAVTAVSVQVGYEPGGHYLGDRGALDVNQAEMTVNLTPRNQRAETQWAIMDEVRSLLQGIPGVTVAIVKEKGGTARSTTAAPIDVRLSGPEAELLDRYGDEVLRRLQAVPGVVNLYKSWALDTPELRVTLDRERAGELGFTGTGIAQAVYTAMEGHAVTPLRQPQRRDLDVWVRYAESDRLDIGALEDVHLRTAQGGSVPLRDVARLEVDIGPRVVTRENFQQTQDVLGFHDGRPLSDAVAEVRTALADLELPAGYRLELAGEQTDFQEAQGRMLRALALGIFAVYLVLVAQFRSFAHPITIMLAIPLQFLGAAAALLIAGKYLSMPALLGVILLGGTVLNNSIVLIDYILARRREGATLRAAIVESVSLRYRPIMMTALSDVAGMLPLALERAVGAERFSPIATVVIGGVVTSTLLTLIVIPTVFMLMERFLPAAQSTAGQLAPARA